MRNKTKYNSIKTEVNGIIFHSRKEANYYTKLEMLKKANGNDKVLDIELQPRFDVIIKGKNCGFYKADFRVKYPNRTEIIDVKGFRTPLYKFKKKVVEALYDIKIIEV